MLSTKIGLKCKAMRKNVDILNSLYTGPSDIGDSKWAILKDYMVTSDEYQDSYNFIPLLKHLYYYDSSDSPQEWFTYKNERIKAHWIIFVTCRPQDMDRLSCVARRMGLNIEVREDEPDDMLLPFR